jgi:FkbM family methyltransferase
VGNFVDTLFKLQKNGFKAESILDIGACYGHWTNAARTIYPDALYTLIEPIEYKINLRGVKVIHTLLGETDNELVSWYEMRNTGDSIYKENTGFFKSCEPVQKLTTSLDSLGLGKYDIIKIDTQGSELPILKGGKKTISGTPIILLEIPFVGEYNKGVPDFAEHIAYMDSIGYTPFDIAEHHYLDGFLIQVDIAFVLKGHFLLKRVQQIINRFH